MIEFIKTFVSLYRVTQKVTHETDDSNIVSIYYSKLVIDLSDEWKDEFRIELQRD